jgi:hypothetical protein
MEETKTQSKLKKKKVGSKRNVKNRTSPKKGLGTRIKEMHHAAKEENKSK